MDDVLPFPSNGRRVGRPVGRRITEAAPPRPSPREAIGDVLRTERHDQDRTLADVAERAHVSLPYLSEVERGRKDVSSDVLTSIADALELPVPVLFERAAERMRFGTAEHGAARMQLLAA